jgi:hypothetical protein
MERTTASFGRIDASGQSVKACDAVLMDPNQNINWETPEGGGGPNYPNM